MILPLIAYYCFILISLNLYLRQGFKKKVVEFSTRREGGLTLGRFSIRKENIGLKHLKSYKSI